MAQATKLPEISEKEFCRQIEQLARLCGWKWYHTRFSWASNAGYPDYHFVRHGKSFFAEVKTNRGKLTRQQTEWLDHLEACGHDVVVWRPADWPHIEEKLR